MNKEDQNIEYKQSWHDEYLKWICGFANAHGGKLVIGVDDHGTVVGVAKFRFCHFPANAPSQTKSNQASPSAPNPSASSTST